MRKNKKNTYALGILAAAVLSACSGGGGSGSSGGGGQNSQQLLMVAPSILPSLANKTGINYVGVYNPSDVAISGVKYSLTQQVGSGNSISMDMESAIACATVAAKSSCYLKLSVPESTIAGGAVVTAIESNGLEAAPPLAIGVQQVPYTESANANGVGLYFYSKAQYSESGVPFILVTAVVQSPNVGNINTIELVDESGNVIPNQSVVSGNSGAGSSPLQMGDVVEIALLLPQGTNLTQNMKVQTSFQTLDSSVLNSIANKLNLKGIAPKAVNNKTIGNQVYTITTQGSNINLQFTPNQVYLTGANPLQYGYLYNIGNLTASQIQLTSGSPNVRVTAADVILNGQRVINVTYELINTTVAPATNMVTVSAANPSGQVESNTGTTNQNVNPDVVPVPTPTPTPTPTPPSPPPPPPGPTPTPAGQYAYITNYDDSVTKCSIAANGDLTDCAHTGGTLTRPSGIAITPSKTHAYIITNSEDNPAVVTRCTIEPADGSLFDCQDAGATDVAYSSAIAIDSSGTYAYIANHFGGTITSCTINQVSGNLEGCVDSSATFSSPFGVALDQSATIAYVTNGLGASTVSGCDIAGGGDTLSSCVINDFSSTGLVNLGGIAINSLGNRAFITSGAGAFLSCPVTGKTIGLDCSATSTALDNPIGVALNEDETIAYVVNYSNETVAKCTIAEDGTIVGCADSGATNLHGSNSIAIWSSPF